MPADNMTQTLLAKVFTEAGFFNAIKDLLVEPTESWGAAQEPSGYQFPTADPGFDRTQKWASWIPAMDWCLFQGMGLNWPDTPTQQADLTNDIRRLRGQLADLAQKPPEYRLQIVSSWAEFTTLTGSLTQMGGPVC